MAAWIGGSALTCVPIYFNNRLSAASVMVVFAFGLLCAILVLINRLRTLRKSRVSVSAGSIDLSLVLWDGYTTAVGIGRRSKIRSYTVFGQYQARLSAGGIRLEGNVVRQENLYEAGRTKRKEKWSNTFTIPPFFDDWDYLVYQITGRS